MPKKKRKKTRIDDAVIVPPPRVYRTMEYAIRTRGHIKSLGFEYIEDYYDWCRESGFKQAIQKGYANLQKEKEEFVRQSASAALVKSKEDNKPQNRIKKILERWSDRVGSKKATQELLLHVDKYTDLIDDYGYSLVRLANYRNDWIRKISKWRPQSHNRHKQFSSLTRHLFAKYAVPLFMDSAWENGIGDFRYERWFIHIGSGGSLRTRDDLPLPMTKKMIHNFLDAPSNYDPQEAIRWGQVMSLEGTPRLVDAINAARLGLSPDRNEFWLSVFRFFINHPMLDLAHFGSIIDYIKNQKWGGDRVFVAPGVVENAPPPQPNFSMHKRDPQALLNQVEDWHKQLGRAKKGKNRQWEKCGIEEHEYMIGGEGKNLKIWTIKEILNERDLIKEGKEMKHCVASYVGSCVSKRCSIWTMEVDSFKGKEKRATIEVELRNDPTIVQVSGKQSDRLKPQELNILNRWARKAGLKTSRYINI